MQGVNTYFLSIIKRKGNINPLARLIIKDIHIYLNGNKKNQRYFFLSSGLVLDIKIV